MHLRDFSHQRERSLEASCPCPGKDSCGGFCRCKSCHANDPAPRQLPLFCRVAQLLGVCRKSKDKLLIVKTGLSILAVCWWPQQPFRFQEWYCAGLAHGGCWRAAWEGTDALQLCPAKRTELETKERGNLGQQGRKRAKEGIYFFGILLFAPGEKNIHESPSATLVQPGLHHSIHEGGADSSQPV